MTSHTNSSSISLVSMPACTVWLFAMLWSVEALSVLENSTGRALRCLIVASLMLPQPEKAAQPIRTSRAPAPAWGMDASWPKRPALPWMHRESTQGFTSMSTAMQRRMADGSLRATSRGGGLHAAPLRASPAIDVDLGRFEAAWGDCARRRTQPCWSSSG